MHSILHFGASNSYSGRTYCHYNADVSIGWEYNFKVICDKDSCLLRYDLLDAGKQTSDVSNELAVFFLNILGIDYGGSKLSRNVTNYLRLFINT